MEIRSQTGLRGLAALIVTLSHLPLVAFCSPIHNLYAWLLCGPQAVELFFILSGFILGYVYLAPDKPTLDWKSFHRARFARILPLHVITTTTIGVLALLMASRGMVDAENYQLRDYLPQIFLIQAYPIIGFEGPWNYVSWSISIEYFCYVFLFPLCYLLHRVQRFRSATLCFAMIAALVSIDITQLLHNPGEDLHSWVAIGRGFCSFLTGYFVYRISADHKSLAQWFVSRANLVFAATFALLVILSFYSINKWYLLTIFPFLLLSVSHDGNTLVHRFLSWKPLHYLGLISYSLYMWHALESKIIGTVFRNFFPDQNVDKTLLGAFLYFATLAIIFATAAISYHWLEMPLKTNTLRWLGGRQRPTSPHTQTESV